MRLPPRLSPIPLLMLACAVGACQRGPDAPDAVGGSLPIATAAVDDLVAHGEYIVRIGGCNDCHTAGYAERSGDVPTGEWLTGSPLGYHGPWGTTYASNLRLTVDDLDEAEWLAYTANLHTRPIMPDFMLRQMRERDRRAIHRFVRSLGPAGEPAPEPLPPGRIPPPPYFQLVAHTPTLPAPERRQAAADAQNGQNPVQ